MAEYTQIWSQAGFSAKDDFIEVNQFGNSTIELVDHLLAHDNMCALGTTS